MNPKHDVTGVILAGGQGRRMGGCDKGWVELAGRPLVARALERLAPQVAEVVIVANRHLDAYRRLPARVVCDAEAGYHGPLMGIYSAMRAATTPWVAITPCDSPALPVDLVARLAAEVGDADIAVAHDGERLHPVVALLRTRLADDLHGALQAGERAIRRWYAGHAWRQVGFADCPESFANLNTEDERRRLEMRLQQEKGNQ